MHDGVSMDGRLSYSMRHHVFFMQPNPNGFARSACEPYLGPFLYPDSLYIS